MFVRITNANSGVEVWLNQDDIVYIDELDTEIHRIYCDNSGSNTITATHIDFYDLIHPKLTKIFTIAASEVARYDQTRSGQRVWVNPKKIFAMTKIKLETNWTPKLATELALRGNLYENIIVEETPEDIVRLSVKNNT